MAVEGTEPAVAESILKDAGGGKEARKIRLGEGKVEKFRCSRGRNRGPRGAYVIEGGGDFAG